MHGGPPGHPALCDTACVKTTLDSLLDGKVMLEQPAPGCGYRFNEDSVLVARLAARDRTSIGHLLDLGAGVGAIALCAAKLLPVDKLTLVERDPQACALARANLERAGLGGRARVIETDVAALGALEPADLVVMNPPYCAPGAGRPSPVLARDRARRGLLEPFFAAAARSLAADGRLFVSMPAQSTVAVLQAAQGCGLHALSAGFVFSGAGRPARIVIVQLARTPGDFVVVTLGACGC